MSKEPKDSAQIKLRMPQKLRKQLEDAARKNKRSLIKESVIRLQDSFAGEKMMTFEFAGAITEAVKAAFRESDAKRGVLTKPSGTSRGKTSK